MNESSSARHFAGALALLAFVAVSDVRADVVRLFQIDPDRSYVEAAHRPVLVIDECSFVLGGPACPPPLPDTITSRHELRGWLELTELLPPSTVFFGNDFRLRPLVLQTSSPYRAFDLIVAPGRWTTSASAQSVEFSEQACAFFIGPGSCWSIDQPYGWADGTFDGTTLALSGFDPEPIEFELPSTDYRFVVYAVTPVPAPAALWLALSGLLALGVAGYGRRKSSE